MSTVGKILMVRIKCVIVVGIISEITKTHTAYSETHTQKHICVQRLDKHIYFFWTIRYRFCAVSLTVAVFVGVFFCSNTKKWNIYLIKAACVWINQYFCQCLCRVNSLAAHCVNMFENNYFRTTQFVITCASFYTQLKYETIVADVKELQTHLKLFGLNACKKRKYERMCAKLASEIFPDSLPATQI